MLTLRTFRNTDAAALLKIWERAGTNPQHFRPLSMPLLDTFVLGRPNFDRNGLFLAFDENENPVGFAHAVFAANASHTNIDTSAGIVCMMMILPDYENAAEVADALLKACEEYLMRRGAKQIYGGAMRPAVPFYMGLYGGSEPLGVFESDKEITKLYQRSGYEVCEKTLLYRVSLENYRPPINSKIMAWRRKKLEWTLNDLPSPKDWWDACLMSHFTWLELHACLPNTVRPIASATVCIIDSNEMPDYRSLTPFSTTAVIPTYPRSFTAGLTDIWVRDDCRKQGLATHLLCEMLRETQKEFVETWEIQASENNPAFLALLKAMRWNATERGEIFLKK